jgi:hypothetical protein
MRTPDFSGGGWLDLTRHFVPCTAALSWNMRHQETESASELSVSAPQGHHELGASKPGRKTRLTLPIPAIKFAQGLESGFPYPAKQPSSRNGESGSSNNAIRSRALINRFSFDGAGCRPGDHKTLTQELTALLMSVQR